MYWKLGVLYYTLILCIKYCTSFNAHTFSVIFILYISLAYDIVSNMEYTVYSMYCILRIACFMFHVLCYTLHILCYIIYKVYELTLCCVRHPLRGAVGARCTNRSRGSPCAHHCVGRGLFGCLLVVFLDFPFWDPTVFMILRLSV